MAKSEILKTLDEETFDWIEYQKKKQKEKIPGRPNDESKQQNTRRQRFFHIRQVALKELADLKRLGECLPEDQQCQVFNAETLTPLFDALFRFGEADGVTRVAKGFTCTPEALKRRQRLLKLSYDIINLLNNPLLSELLTPAFHMATNLEQGALPHLRAIYYASFIASEQPQTQSPRK